MTETTEERSIERKQKLKELEGKFQNPDLFFIKDGDDVDWYCHEEALLEPLGSMPNGVVEAQIYAFGGSRFYSIDHSRDEVVKGDFNTEQEALASLQSKEGEEE